MRDFINRIIELVKSWFSTKKGETKIIEGDK